jgi:hypothetical protein
MWKFIFILPGNPNISVCTLAIALNTLEVQFWRPGKYTLNESLYCLLVHSEHMGSSFGNSWKFISFSSHFFWIICTNFTSLKELPIFATRGPQHPRLGSILIILLFLFSNGLSPAFVLLDQDDNFFLHQVAQHMFDEYPQNAIPLFTTWCCCSVSKFCYCPREVHSSV